MGDSDFSSGHLGALLGFGFRFVRFRCLFAEETDRLGRSPQLTSTCPGLPASSLCKGVDPPSSDLHFGGSFAFHATKRLGRTPSSH